MHGLRHDRIGRAAETQIDHARAIADQPVERRHQIEDIGRIAIAGAMEGIDREHARLWQHPDDPRSGLPHEQAHDTCSVRRIRRTSVLAANGCRRELRTRETGMARIDAGVDDSDARGNRA